MKQLLLSTAIILAVCTPVEAGIPVVDLASLAQYLEENGILALDQEKQITKDTVASENLAAENAKVKLETQTLEAVSGQRDIQRNLATTEAFANNPMSFDMSADATRLFGKPRPSLENKIIAAAMNEKSSAGVKKAGLDPLTWRIMFQSLVRQESAFNPTAQSHVGAYGLTQLMPPTAAELGVNPYDVDDNLRGGAQYISQQLNTFGKIDLALAAYNAGAGNVRKYGGVPPFRETQGYVTRIRGFMREYISRYGGHLPDSQFEGALMASGEMGYVASSLANYADQAYSDANAAILRLQAIEKKINGSPDLKYSSDLKNSAQLEVQKLQAIFVRLKAAVAEAQSVYLMALAKTNSQTSNYFDWTYK